LKGHKNTHTHTHTHTHIADIAEDPWILFM